MHTQAKDIRIVHRVIGTKHVLTSLDVPELYIAHADRDFAERHVQDALDSIGRAKARIAAS